MSDPRGSIPEVAPFGAIWGDVDNDDVAANLLAVGGMIALQSLFAAIGIRAVLASALRALLGGWAAFAPVPGFARTWLVAFAAGVLAMALGLGVLLLLTGNREVKVFLPAMRVHAFILLAFSFFGMLGALASPLLGVVGVFAWLGAYFIGLYETWRHGGGSLAWQAWCLPAGAAAAVSAALYVMLRCAVLGVFR